MHKQDIRSGVTNQFIPDLFSDLNGGPQEMTEHADGSKSLVVESQDVVQADQAPQKEPENTPRHVAAAQIVGAAVDEPEHEEETEQDDAAQTDTQLAIPETVTVEKVDGLGFTAFWLKYLASVQAADELITSTRKMGEGVFGMGRRIGRDIETRSMTDATRAEIGSMLIQRAEREFAPLGGSLKVNTSDYAHLLPTSFYKDEDADWDPDKLWVALETTYGGDQGAEVGLRQLAESLVSLFYMKGRPPVRKSNRMELSVTVYCDKYSNKRTLHYNSVESLRKILRGLIEFCRYAEDFQTARDIQRAIDEVACYHSAVVSRKRYELGSIQVLMFFERVVFEFHGDIADKFQLFIGTYGREALERE
jgi:hypothetical protein